MHLNSTEMSSSFFRERGKSQKPKQLAQNILEESDREDTSENISDKIGMTVELLLMWLVKLSINLLSSVRVQSLMRYSGFKS